MSEFENPSSGVPQSSELADLKEQFAALERHTTWLFASLVVLSFTLTAFLGLQARRSGKELDMIKPQATQVIENSRQEGPQVQAFFGRLVEYGKTHPDFAPILTKYGLRPTNAAAPAAPVKK